MKLVEADKKRRALLTVEAEKRADELVAAGVGNVVIEVINVDSDAKVGLAVTIPF